MAVSGFYLTASCQCVQYSMLQFLASILPLLLKKALSLCNAIAQPDWLYGRDQGADMPACAPQTGDVAAAMGVCSISRCLIRPRKRVGKLLSGNTGAPTVDICFQLSYTTDTALVAR